MIDLDLTGKRAIVTGASIGIGAATVRLLADHGADVAFCARGEDGVNALAGALASRLDAAKRRMTAAEDVESRPLQRVVQSDPPPDEDDHDLY